MRSLLTRASVLLLTVLFNAIATPTQVVNGTISGCVLDASGAYVPDAVIRAVNVDTGVAAETTSDTFGLFQLSHLAAGTYNLEIIKEGFRKYVVSGVTVSVGTDYGLGTIQLILGPVHQSVTVTAAPPLLQSTEAETSVTFAGPTLESMPGLQEGLGLDVMALLLPGVHDIRDNGGPSINGVGFSVNGQRGRSNDQQIDGQNNNDTGVGGPELILVNPSFVQEYQLVTNNFSPEYGRNSAAVVNIVTPSGTNNWHGTSSITEANSALVTLTNVEKEFLGLTKPTWFNDEFASATISGPIRKDHIFLFGGFDERITEQTSHFVSQGLTPTPAGLVTLASCFPNSTSIAALKRFGPYGIRAGNPVPLEDTVLNLTITGSNLNPACQVEFSDVQRVLGNPYHQYDFIGRTDINRGPNRVYVRYLHNFSNLIDAETGAGAAGYPENLPFRIQNLLVGWVRPFTPRMTNELRLGLRWLNGQSGGNTLGDTIPTHEQVGSAIANVRLAGERGNPILGFGGPPNEPQGFHGIRYQMQDGWDYLSGKNEWKAGVNLTRQLNRSTFLPDYNGAFGYTSVVNSSASPVNTADCSVPPGGSLSAFAAFACNLPSTIAIADGDPTHGFREFDTFLYVGDNVKLRPNFTINLGLTWSFFGQPINQIHSEVMRREADPATALWDSKLPLSSRTVPAIPATKNNWGPGIGFAWSPSSMGWITRGSGRTVVRGGYRIAYDPPYYNIYANVVTSAPSVLLQTLSGAAANANPLPAEPFGFNVRSELAPFIGVGTQDPRAADQTTVARDFRPDRVQSWSFGIQRELTRNVVFEVQYVGNHGENLFQSINVNPLIDSLSAVFPDFLPPSAMPCPPGQGVGPSATGRLDCTHGLVRERTNSGYSDYHGLQTQIRSAELWNQLTFMTSYTWSKTTDNVSEISPTFGAGTTVPFSQNPLNYKSAEHGYSGLDFPHSWSLNFYEQMPSYAGKRGWLAQLLGGWALSGNYFVSSGQPFTPAQFALNTQTGGVGFDSPFDTTFGFGLFETARPFLANPRAPVTAIGVFAADACLIFFGAGCGLPADTLLSFNSINADPAANPATVNPRAVHYIVNGAEAQTVFRRPYGDAARNSLRDAITNTGNLSIMKKFRIGERSTLRWRMTLLNVFNHPNYQSVDPFIDDAGFRDLGIGFATPQLTSGGNRTILFGVSLAW